MPAVRSVVRRSGSGSQSFLQHGYFIAAAVILIALLILRIFILRWRKQRAQNSFGIGNSSDGSNNVSGYRGVQLTPLPAAYRSDRRVRSTDTDAFGRRLGATGEDWGGKDALPAYDSLGRPPKYIEAGLLHGELPHPTEGEPGRIAHPNTVNGTPWDYVD